MRVTWHGRHAWWQLVNRLSGCSWVTRCCWITRRHGITRCCWISRHCRIPRSVTGNRSSGRCRRVVSRHASTLNAFQQAWCLIARLNTSAAIAGLIEITVGNVWRCCSIDRRVGGQSGCRSCTRRWTGAVACLPASASSSSNRLRLNSSRLRLCIARCDSTWLLNSRIIGVWSPRHATGWVSAGGRRSNGGRTKHAVRVEVRSWISATARQG
jgi:hypothetical protein